MINRLVVENLQHRPVRTLLGIAAIALEVAMILTLVGLSRGMLAESARRARGVGADIWVRPPGTSVMTFSTAGMPEGLVRFFESYPGVAVATGNIVHPLGGFDSISGIDFEKFSQMSGGFVFRSGGPFRGPDDIIVDERYAVQNKLRVGGAVKLIGRDWRVCGIVEQGKLARLFLPIKLLQELTGNTGKISQIFVKLDDPKAAEAMVAELKKKLEGYQIYSIEEFASLYSVDTVPGLKPFITVVISLSVIVGFMVVFLSMYTAVLERTREIGILKSLGASRGYVMSLFMREATVLAVGGAVTGILLAFGTQWTIHRFGGPALVQHVVPDWWPWTTLLAISGSLLGTLYPSMKAIRQDTLAALAYD